MIECSSGPCAGACFFRLLTVMDQRKYRLLILSVGYGQGHHSAATAVAEYYAAEGWDARVVDVCELAQPRLFRLTQRFYDFCVRKAPWLWGVTYSLTGTADWASLVRSPVLQKVVNCLRETLCSYNPDMVVCTYPLFAYMLDSLAEGGMTVPPYAVLVTDALEISRPWMRSRTPLVMLPDEVSSTMVLERYAFSTDAVVATGFPVRRAFSPWQSRPYPGEYLLRIVYGAYRQTGGVLEDINALMGSFPQLRMTVIAGARAALLRKRLYEYCAAGRLDIVDSTSCMHQLLAESHLYIGKAGAATMFECYAANVPVLVNFTLPGQERGNLDLLLMDGAGCHVESTPHLVAVIEALLRDDAAGWNGLCESMRRAGRAGGARRVGRAIREKFGI